MPTVVDALFEDLRAVLLKVREGAGVIVGLDRDVLDADMSDYGWIRGALGQVLIDRR